jgi:hypothetical protein
MMEKVLLPASDVLQSNLGGQEPEVGPSAGGYCGGLVIPS